MFRIVGISKRSGGGLLPISWMPIRDYVSRAGSRTFSQVAQKYLRRVTKKEGTVAEFFENLTHEGPPLPVRFAELKKEMCVDSDAIAHSWSAVLKELEGATDEIVRRGNEMVMCVPYEDIQRGLSEQQLKMLKTTGVIIVKGGVPQREALSWMQSIKDYVAVNTDRVKGAPPDKIVFYEIYNSKAQILARTHPALITTQKYLLSLWHTSVPDSNVSVRTPISYFDRFRIRSPGPSAFTLGPHIDGGSIERWEDPAFRMVWRRILEGGDSWLSHDPFDISPRLDANQDLYNVPAASFEGISARSSVHGKGGRHCPTPDPEKLASGIASAADIPLAADAWVIDLDNPAFPGSTPGKTQAVMPQTHPHLRIDKTIVSIPRVEPGDQVYWHTDVVHAVEANHDGPEDSSVLYIPAVPLTERNAAYLRDQRETFLQGLPSPDFPGGEGESRCIGRARLDDINHVEGRRILGFEPFQYDSCVNVGERRAITAANEIMGF